jgi:tRNA pseudouridine32 synthase / 23S rRNA pseudouridine746 synthase
VGTPDEHARPSRLQLAAGPWIDLIDGLCARFPNVTRATWLDRFARGRVLDAQGAALAPDTRWRVGLEIRYFREIVDEPPIPYAEALLHVDDRLVVADKPHFLPVTPSGGYVRETLLARLQRRLANPDLVPLHRIDRDTAGLVLFSCDVASRGAYQQLFARREMGKRYEAIAPALPHLAFPLHRRSRIERCAAGFTSREVDGAPNSETRIDVLARDGAYWRYTLAPLSGRQHQLRVHMAALGAPILHDPLYPQRIARTVDDPARALQLLAAGIDFVDPVSGEPRRFRSGFTL